jgi:hypothetical protein
MADRHLEKGPEHKAPGIAPGRLLATVMRYMWMYPGARGMVSAALSGDDGELLGAL